MMTEGCHTQRGEHDLPADDSRCVRAPRGFMYKKGVLLFNPSLSLTSNPTLSPQPPPC